MTIHQDSRFCRRCNRCTLHVKTTRQTHFGSHLVLTIITCGFWLPVGFVLALAEIGWGFIAPWYCQVCGTTN
jgi:hypothetical protein